LQQVAIHARPILSYDATSLQPHDATPPANKAMASISPKSGSLSVIVRQHGAFDRNHATTYHAYDLLFVEMTLYAIEHDLKLIDVGSARNAQWIWSDIL